MGRARTLAAVAEDHGARCGRRGRGNSFLAVLAASTFVTNAAAMLLQEKRSALTAAELPIFVYYALGESHRVLLIAGTAAGFLLAVTVLGAVADCLRAPEAQKHSADAQPTEVAREFEPAGGPRTVRALAS